MEFQTSPLTALRERECEIMEQLNRALMSAALRWGYADPPGAELRAAVEQAHQQLQELDAYDADAKRRLEQMKRSAKKNPIGPDFDLGPPYRGTR
jgi:hypothetical protein